MDYCPGDLVMINDHINMQGSNPLIGQNDDTFGPRFPALDPAYDEELCSLFMKQAADHDIVLRQGVYVSVLGPSYETRAEVRAFRALGGDVVGMSTVPEVIVANHCGLRVAVISTVTNFGTGLTSEKQNHEEVVLVASQAAVQLKQLVKAFVGSLTTIEESLNIAA